MERSVRAVHCPGMRRDILKTLSYLVIHLTIGFSVAYALTGSIAIAGGIALIEPCINAIAFFFHEKAWDRAGRKAQAEALAAQAALTPSH